MGIFRGVKFLWMIGFVVIRGKKIVVGSGINHTHHALVDLMASSFEVKAVWCEVTTSIKRSGMHKLATTPCSAAAVSNQWTGLLEWTTGMDFDLPPRYRGK